MLQSCRYKYLFIICIAIFIVSIVYIFYKPFIPTYLLCDKRNYDIPDGVTRIIHQSWKTKDLPGRFKTYRDSWTKHCFSDWKYIFWTDEDNLKLITDHYPWFLKKYKELPEAINRADVSRYFYLFHYGGIYTDLDNECLRPFENLLQNYSLVFGAMKGQYGGTSLAEGYVQNSFMYSQPRNPFWLNIIITIFNNTKYRVPELDSGPVLLSDTIKRFRANDHGNELFIYPPELFNPYSWLRKHESSKYCKDLNQMSDDEWRKCKEFFTSKGAYIIQYHAHTWGKKR